MLRSKAAVQSSHLEIVGVFFLYCVIESVIEILVLLVCNVIIYLVEISKTIDNLVHFLYIQYYVGH